MILNLNDNLSNLDYTYIELRSEILTLTKMLWKHSVIAVINAKY